MKRKTEQKGLFGSLSFSSTMILFGLILAVGAIAGLVVTSKSLKQERIASQSQPPLRAIHIKPELAEVKREQSVSEADKKVLMSPAMLRQMSLLDERLGALERQIRSLSKSNLDLAEKMDTSGIDTRIEALEDSLQNFTASIDKRIKANAAQSRRSGEPLPSMTELTPEERRLLPPPFKTDSPQDVSDAAQKRDQEQAARMEREKAEQERLAKLKVEQERIAREKAEAERIAQEKAEAERLAKLKAEQERIAREKAEAERLAKLKAEQERLAAERIAREKAEAERLAAERLAAKRLAEEQRKREAAERARIAKLEAEKEQLLKEKAELERKARAKAEEMRIAREKLEAERVAAEKLTRERRAAAKRKAEEIAAKKREAERIAAKKREAEKLAAEKLAREKRAREETERARMAQLKAEREKAAAVKRAAERAKQAAKEKELMKKAEQLKKKKEVAKKEKPSFFDKLKDAVAPQKTAQTETAPKKAADPQTTASVTPEKKQPVKPLEKESGKTGWEPVVTYHNAPKPTRMASVQRKPRFSTQKSSPEITGSVKTKAAKPKPAPKKSKPKKIAVHIGSASNIYTIKDSWLTLQRDNGILRALKPYILAADAKDSTQVPFRLLAGPVKSADEALRICTRLNAKGNYCRSTSLRGHPLKF